MAGRVLIVEDEPKLASLLTDYLVADGYDAIAVPDGRDVMAALQRERPDLILLDLNLPGRDGLELCRDIRACSNVPIVIVTARIDEIDRLLGLETGADDYVCKPFSPREVVARVRAILRRSQASGQRIPVPGLDIDTFARRVTLAGVGLDLTPVEFRLLKTLSDSPGRVFSRQQLVDHLYIDHRVVDVRTVDSHVKNLRKKLLKVAPDHDLIQSIYGVGYKMEIS